MVEQANSWRATLKTGDANKGVYDTDIMDKNHCLLKCDAVDSGKNLPMLLRKVLTA
jgi:hypothetical protein